MENEALSNLRGKSKDWNKQVKEVLDEGKFDYLRIRENNPNTTDPAKYRISILARSTWRGDGFGDPRESGKLRANKTQILLKVGGYVIKKGDNSDFYLGQPSDEYHNIIQSYTGETVRNSLPGFKDSELEEMVSNIAENYRGKEFGKDFLRDIVDVTNNYISKFKK